MTTPQEEAKPAYCACCSRRLEDEFSIQYGMGPECRKRHPMRLTGDQGQAAHKLIRFIACRPSFTELAAALTELNMLGCVELAQTIAKRQASITVKVMDTGRLLVKTPMTDGSLQAIRAIKGRRPEYEEETAYSEKRFIGNSFPAAKKNEVWHMLRRCFPGAVGIGPKGAFTVPTRDEDPKPVLIATVRPSATEVSLPGTCGDEPGCPHCGDPEFHDGEECLRLTHEAREAAAELKAEQRLARQRGEFEP